MTMMTMTMSFSLERMRLIRPYRALFLKQQQSRALSTLGLTKVHFDRSTATATLTLERPPANSLSLEMCQSISESIRQVEADSSMHTMIVASSHPTIFSAGLDLSEFLKDREHLYAFWRSFQQVYLDLYGCRLSTIAAIGGHAPAAGCMLALSCDYRILSSKASIGLNESAFGIVAPPWLGQQLVDVIGTRRAELAMSLGTLFSGPEAKGVGIVDEVVQQEQILERAREMAAQYNRIPPHARLASKMLIRKQRLDTLRDTRDDDVDTFVNFITQPTVQQSLQAYIDKLSSKSKK